MSEEQQQQPAPKPQIDWRKAESLYFAGASYSTICAEVAGCSLSALSKHVQRNGLAAKRAAANAVVLAPAPSGPDQRNDDLQAESQKAREKASREVLRSLETLEKIPHAATVPKVTARAKALREITTSAAGVYQWDEQPLRGQLISLRALHGPRLISRRELERMEAAKVIDVASVEPAAPSEPAPEGGA